MKKAITKMNENELLREFCKLFEKVDESTSKMFHKALEISDDTKATNRWLVSEEYEKAFIKHQNMVVRLVLVEKELVKRGCVMKYSEIKEKKLTEMIEKSLKKLEE